MGSGISILGAAERHFAAEFNRLQKMRGQNYLVLSDLRQIQPMEGMQLDLTHLGTMFVLDRDHDGRISLDDLMKFATFCASKGKDCQPHEFQLQMQGHCTLSMYDTLSAAGIDIFVAWFARLFGEDFATYTFEEYPGVEFMIRDVAHTMHDMFQINDNYGYDMQSFLDLIQRTGEEMGIMSLQDERLDDLVPVVVLEKLARAFAEGLLALLARLNFAPEPA
mmetsp:Transcript_33807/g.70917  ORF Transcript_33807/g.70917 Transcript_33807/m.70917 type:complete len:221 (-) Transcript_33807:17-679(-)